MITSRQQNIVQNQNIVIESLSFEKVEKLSSNIWLEIKNDIREEIKRRMNMGNACYYSLEKILSSRLLSKKLKVNTNYYITSWGRRVIGISKSLFWSKTLMELISNPYGEFRCEGRRAQLAKTTLLTSTLVPLGSFQIC